MIVMFGQQLPRVPGVQPAEQHQDRGAAVLMAAGQRGFASLRVQSVAAITIAICRSAQCELSACSPPAGCCTPDRHGWRVRLSAC
jgi:hypothetical protein